VARFFPFSDFADSFARTFSLFQAVFCFFLRRPIVWEAASLSSLTCSQRIDLLFSSFAWTFSLLLKRGIPFPPLPTVRFVGCLAPKNHLSFSARR